MVMETVSKLHHRHPPLHRLSLHHHRPSFPGPIISSFSFRNPLPPLSPSLKASLSIKAASASSSSSDSLLPNPNGTPKPQFVKTPKPLFPLSILKTTAVAAVAAAAIFFARFHYNPVASTAVSPPPMVEKSVSDEDREKTLEECVNSNPNDVKALRSLMEAKIKSRKVDEAIGIVEKLIELEPGDIEWPLLRSHMYCHSGKLEMAKLGFNEILEKDPFRVEAYHGLVMAASESVNELKEVEKRVGEAMEMCRGEKKAVHLRDFKLLMAQIRVIEGDYSKALKVYQELAEEEPRDFRPYLCQGIIYTLLKKEDEAEKQFRKSRRLVPKGHPYAQYLDDNMISTKNFARKVENERVGSTG